MQQHRIMTNSCLIKNMQGDIFSAVVHLVGSSSSSRRHTFSLLTTDIISCLPHQHCTTAHCEGMGENTEPRLTFHARPGIDIIILASDLQL